MAEYTFQKKQFTDADADALRAFADADTDRRMEWDAAYQLWTLESSKSQAEAENFALTHDMNLVTGDSSHPWHMVSKMKEYLHKEMTLVKGKPTLEIFYEEQVTDVATGAVTFSGPVLKEEYQTAVRNGGNFIIEHPRHTFFWDPVAGDWDPNYKVFTQKYTLFDGVREGKERRELLMDKLKVDILGLLVVDLMGKTNPSTSANYTYSEAKVAAELLGGEFIVTYYTQMQMFITDAIPTLIASVSAHDTSSSMAWLDYDIGGGTTIKQFVVSQLTINQGE